MSDYFQTQELIQDFEPSFTPELLDRSLLIVGLGGNGSHIAVAVVRMGFRSVVGVDCDLVSPSNLSRQVLYTRQDIGRSKADAAAESLARHNLRSEIRTHHLDILQERRRFGELVAAADLVFVVLDQPGTTFFAIDTCYRHRKAAVSGGTCVLSGLSTRVGWMGPGQRPCLNCAFSAHPSVADWVRFYRYDGGVAKTRSPAVEQQEQMFALRGGHPSTYPTACLGANLMVAVGLNLFLGRTGVPRQLEFSLLGPAFEARDLRWRKNCPTCGED
jgi:molybdopterin/thiamine biosynthesis adenylyltransferase